MTTKRVGGTTETAGRLDAAALSELVRERMRELKVSQPQLAMLVAQHLGEPVVGQGAVSRWLDDITALSPARVFAIERALDYPPGALSAHCGYLPVTATHTLSVLEAIDNDARLSSTARDLLRGAYVGVSTKRGRSL